jgi:hypothetical protein
MYLNSVPRGYGNEIKLGTVPGTNRPQVVICKPKGFENLNYTSTHTDHRSRIKALDEAGIDKVVLRLPCWEEWLSLKASKKTNDLMAKYVNEHADRFLGLAVAPPWGDEESLDELDRAIRDLHLSGIECAAHYGNLYLDAPEFRPFFRKLNRLNVPICVHHTPMPVQYDGLYDYTNVRRFYGRIMDQMISVSRILHSGMLDEFPNLRFMPTHMGGALFAFTNFLKGPKAPTKADVGRFKSSSGKIERYLAENYFPGVNMPTMWTKAQLECAVEELGADHLLFGAGYPIAPQPLKCVQHIDSLDISDRDKKLILGDNARKLFKIRA